LGPNIKILDEKKDDYDAILITNCFGCSTNIQLYEEFCKINNKILLFDNAASSYTMYNGKNHLNYGNGCMVSLHHTKPIGFGEGGFIVFNNKYLESMKKAICFGFTNTNRHNFNINASNYKMSEINAIYLSDYLNNLTIIYEHNKNMMKYFIKKLDENKLNDHIKIYKNYANYNESLMATIPILFKHDILVDFFITNKIEAKKYYFPLDGTHNISVNIFNKIICLPLNLEVTESVIDMYINLILLIL
jgi:dTDP-4-amino-4,6-dideoxygalactose transaminase